MWVSTSVGTWLTYLHIKKIEQHEEHEEKVEEKDQGYGESVSEVRR